MKAIVIPTEVSGYIGAVATEQEGMSTLGILGVVLLATLLAVAIVLGSIALYLAFACVERDDLEAEIAYLLGIKTED